MNRTIVSAEFGIETNVDWAEAVANTTVPIALVRADWRPGDPVELAGPVYCPQCGMMSAGDPHDPGCPHAGLGFCR